MKQLVPLVKIALILLIPILFLYGVITAKQFLYPLVFGALFTYLLYPAVNFLEKKGIHRVLSILICLIFSVLIVAAVFFMFYRQFLHMFENFETLKEAANNKIELFNNYLEGRLGLEDNRMDAFLSKHINNFFDTENGSLARLFTATTGTIARIIIIPVFVFLFLYYRTKFAYFILKITKKENKTIVLNILRDISTVAARYMGGVTLVVFILCIINSSGLAIIGVEYAILLGVVSAIFNYIPYFGTLMGGAVPLLFVLLTTDQPLQNAAQVGFLYVIVQFIENNILTPNIVGGNVKINPFFIIVGLVFGSMVWGIPGMLVIIPFLAIARIIFTHVPSLKPYAFLLGPRGTQQFSISFKVKKLWGKLKRKIKDD